MRSETSQALEKRIEVMGLKRLFGDCKSEKLISTKQLMRVFYKR